MLQDLIVNSNNVAVPPYEGDFFAGGGSNKLSQSVDGLIWTDKASALWYPRQIAYNGSVYVATTAEVGGVYYSYDLVNWTFKAIGNGDKLFSVAYGNGRFVAIGAYNKGAYSTDGINWTGLAINFGIGSLTSYNKPEINFVNGLFIVTPEAAQFSLSADGISWWKTPWIDASAKRSVAFGNGEFVFGTNGNALCVSADLYSGYDVQSSPGGLATISLAYGNGIWVAACGNVAELWSCTEPGVDAWVSRHIGVGAAANNAEVIFKNGMFVCVAGNKIRTSTDGINWSLVTTSGYDYSFII